MIFILDEGFDKCDFNSMLRPLNDVNSLKYLSMWGSGFESPIKEKSLSKSEGY